jgi:multiple sugar transport system substrate-binding protein
MLDVYTKDGQLYAIPIRAGVWCFWYNKRIFDERGIAGPPQTPEEIYEIAKKCTYTKPNGEKVFGFASRSTRWDLHEQLAIGARMYGGDLITPDYKIVINQEPVIKFLKLYRRMYEEEIIPPNWGSGLDDGLLFREGRSAISMNSNNQGGYFNDPATSNEAGNIYPAYYPLDRELQTDSKKISDSMSFCWAISILKGSTQKDAAWETIRYLLQKDNAIEMAKNRNVPSRISVLEGQAQSDPGAKIAAEVFKYARPALPPLENGNQIIDLIGEHMENVVIKGADPQREMDLAAREIAALL